MIVDCEDIIACPRIVRFQYWRRCDLDEVVQPWSGSSPNSLTSCYNPASIPVFLQERFPCRSHELQYILPVITKQKSKWAPSVYIGDNKSDM